MKKYKTYKKYCDSLHQNHIYMLCGRARHALIYIYKVHCFFSLGMLMDTFVFIQSFQNSYLELNTIEEWRKRKEKENKHYTSAYERWIFFFWLTADWV